MVSLNPLKTLRSHLLPAAWAVASVTPTLDLVGLMLPTERLEVRSLRAGARPEAREVAGAQWGGTRWDIPFSPQWNLGWCPGAARCDGERVRPPTSPLTLRAWCSPVCCWWLAECELKVGYFNKDQPFKTCCMLSRQIFFSLRWISGALKRSFFFPSSKRVN